MHPLMLTRLGDKWDLEVGIPPNYDHHHDQWFSTGTQGDWNCSCSVGSNLTVDWLWVAAEMCAYFPRSEA